MTGTREARVTQKYPPHSIEAEQSVLGGLMLNNAAWHEVSAILCVEDFYTQDHRTIWHGINDLCEEGEPCDFVTLSEKLRQQGNLEMAGGVSYIGTLAADTPSAANVRAYAEIVRERSVLRTLIAIGHDIAEMGYQPGGREPQQLLNTAMKLVSEVNARRVPEVRTMRDVIASARSTIQDMQARRREGKSHGIRIGIPWIDSRTGGFRKGQLVFFGARPSIGKSALLNQLAVHNGFAGEPGLVCSLEMEEDELGFRALAHAAQINMTRLSFGADAEVAWAEEYNAKHALDKLPLFFDTKSYNLHEIIGQIALHRRQHDIRWAAVDHIGLIEASEYRSTIDRMSAVTRELKKLAKQLGIPIIALSQLSRGVEKDQRKPRMSDLRDCGTIEQDANVVLFLHSEAEDGTVNPNIELILAKNRGGRRGASGPRFEFRGDVQTFVDVGLPENE